MGANVPGLVRLDHGRLRRSQEPGSGIPRSERRVAELAGLHDRRLA